MFDIDAGRVRWANREALLLWRAESLEDLRQRDMATDMSESVARRLRQYQADFERYDSRFSESWTLYPQGSPRTMLVEFSGIRVAGRMMMLCECQGQLQLDADTLMRAEGLLHTSAMISMYGEDGMPLYRNPAAREKVLDPSAGWRERLLDPQDAARLEAQLDQDGQGRLVARVLTRKGERWHELAARRCRDAVSGKSSLLFSEMDISELKEAEARAHYLANHDTLTGLPNRHYVMQAFQALLTRAAAQGLPTALLFVDLDRFKYVNDSLGHSFGDQLLVQMSERLKGLVGARAHLARLGGDEFLLLLAEDEAESAARALALAIREAVARPVRLGGMEVQVTASVGISLGRDGEQDIQTRMRHADLAMYAAKDAGRDDVMCYTPEMGERARARLSLENEIRRGLENGEFLPYYQPQVDCGSGRIVGAEALVRWQHPERGLLLPGAFISVCEESGLIRELDLRIFREAAHQLADWRARGWALTVSVNLSARQFTHPSLLPDLCEILRQTGCKADWIELEITESLLLGRDQATLQTLTALREAGFAIAIDDFGTGYSNLGYLQQYPLTTLKIDRSFISRLPEDAAIAELVITLCRLLKLSIVAEGVERQAQLDWLRGMQCEQYQGFLCSPALPVKHFEELLD